MRLYPSPLQELAAEDIYADLSLPRPTGRDDLPYVVINMVSTLDGKISAGGKASPIGSHVDRLVMRSIRCAVDAVLVGAGTVRAEEMNLGVPKEMSERRKERGLQEQPLGVILAGSRELPLERKVFRRNGVSQDQRIVVIAGDGAPETTLEKASDLGVLVLKTEGSGLPEPKDVLKLLNDRLNISSVLLEGGPSINGSFLHSRVVDEIFLTLSPKIFLSQGDALSLASAGEAKTFAAPHYFDLASVHSSTHPGELYLRYLHRHP